MLELQSKPGMTSQVAAPVVAGVVATLAKACLTDLDFCLMVIAEEVAIKSATAYFIRKDLFVWVCI
jgi:hypothetical protein